MKKTADRAKFNDVIRKRRIGMLFLKSDMGRDAERVFIDKIRLMTPRSKFHLMCNLSSSVLSLSKRALKRAYPELMETDRTIKFIELNYGKKLAKEYSEYLKT